MATVMFQQLQDAEGRWKAMKKVWMKAAEQVCG